MQALEKGIPQSIICRKFDVAKFTVTDIWKRHQKMLDSIVANESFSYIKKWCTVHEAKYNLADKDEACWKWFSEYGSKGGLFCFLPTDAGKSEAILLVKQVVLIYRQIQYMDSVCS